MKPPYDAIVIGAGFYGLRCALHLREKIGLSSILILEREPRVMRRASYVNQARVHQGYHYPRSILTGYRSRVSLPRFTEEFAEAIADDFTHYYAIAAELSKVNSAQFQLFCERIGAPLRGAPHDIRELFHDDLVEAVFEVTEPAFDSTILSQLLLDRIKTTGGIDIQTGVEVTQVNRESEILNVFSRKKKISAASAVFNATYASLNEIQRNSGFQMIALQHELTEMAMVDLPRGLRDFAFTVMDGPFFSLMPFPDKGLHTLSHVRYTPHARWFENSATDAETSRVELELGRPASNFHRMIADVKRFMPSLAQVKHVESIWETKTVLQRSAGNDSRPILFNNLTGPENYTIIMGGKIDNVYDALDEIESIYEKTS